MKDFGSITNEQVEKFIPMIYKIIGSRSFSGNLSTDEKYSAGLLGVLVGLNSYDPTRRMRLSNWVYVNILYAVYKETKQQRAKNVEIPLYQDQADEGVRDPALCVEASDFTEFVMRSKRFSPREKRILEYLFLTERLQKDIAVVENLTQGSVSRIKKKTLWRLKKIGF